MKCSPMEIIELEIGDSPNLEIMTFPRELCHISRTRPAVSLVYINACIRLQGS
jgi:hypothetical protein